MEAIGGNQSRSYEFVTEPNASTTCSRLTLGGILSIKEPSPYRIRNPTLLDLIRDDPTSGFEPEPESESESESKKSWRMFTEKLRQKLIGANSHAISTNSNNITPQIVPSQLNSPSPPVNNVNNVDNANNDSSVSVTQTEIEQIEPPVAENEENDDRTSSAEENRRNGGENGGPATVKVSLMSLLRIDGCGYDDEEEVVVDERGKDSVCCVCMVRDRGAAFIPCGHTFCRVCSRELFVKRATCPLCNHFILEILDIF